MVDDYKNLDPKKFSNFMTGNFLKGEGPENYIFPKIGQVSNEMRRSLIVSQAIYNFRIANLSNMDKGKPLVQTNLLSEFGTKGLIHSLGDKGGLVGMPGFVGSALISVKPIGRDSALMSIFNVTSMSSGDLGKMNPLNKEAKSMMRNSSNLKPQPFTNISQYYSFTFKIPR